MSGLKHAALARRLYLHVLNGGQVTARDMGRLVETIEGLEERLQAATDDAIEAEAYAEELRRDLEQIK